MTERNLKSSPPLIDFKPNTEDEEQYLIKLEGLLNTKRRGDWVLVGEIMKCEPQLAEKSFKRVFSKNHAAAVEALEKIINNRNQLLKN